jgi:hypothetical protein
MKVKYDQEVNNAHPSRRPCGPPQAERIRKRIYEMLYLARASTEMPGLIGLTGPMILCIFFVYTESRHAH